MRLKRSVKKTKLPTADLLADKLLSLLRKERFKNVSVGIAL